MTAIHSAPFEGAGKTYARTNGDTVRVEDWWDRVFGKSWMDSNGNFAALAYAVRSASEHLPLNNEVVYGHDKGGIGHLVHVSELAGVSE